MNQGAMLNAYPDSMGGKLSDVVSVLQKEELKNAFQSFYILPSMFHTDLDRGFSVQDYDLEESMATKKDLEALMDMGIDLKLDFILNHASVLSPQFQDLLKNGNASKYKDFFINWNTFWEGHGTMTEEGYIQPDEELIKDMFFRKAGLPILVLEFDDGSRVPYWNTFYQKVWEEKGEKKYLGQMDLNVKSDLVWEFYDETLQKLSSYGASIVRLDAFAYASKEVGAKNFFNEPQTWEILERLTKLANKYGLKFLPEIHASYGEGRYKQVANKGYMTYDFFLPGLMIDALESGDGSHLQAWAQELLDKKISTVNMLGCHDGIPLLDLKGILPDERIQGLIDTVVSRGGYVKDLHGAKNVYYQVNATYYSALGEDDKKMELARAIQLFMPGKPQVWYLDLFVGKNDHEAVRLAGEGGHKEINRTNLSVSEVEERLKMDVVKNQIALLQLRNTHPAFGEDAEIRVDSEGSNLYIEWKRGEARIALSANLKTMEYSIEK
ncbi:MAG: sucrose phosphorylase [Lachnospiraceae bacterium]|nr:sucrose phosphorylase [Lachnospiraceae bacterium]